MRCLNCFCIYWRYDNCSFGYISLDERGCCQQYRPVDIDDEILANERERLFNRLHGNNNIS